MGKKKKKKENELRVAGFLERDEPLQSPGAEELRGGTQAFPMIPPLVTRIAVSLYQPLQGPKGFLCTSSEISDHLHQNPGA